MSSMTIQAIDCFYQTACVASGSKLKLSETCRLHLTRGLWPQIKATHYAVGSLLKVKEHKG